jgi:hypothetical protein
MKRLLFVCCWLCTSILNAQNLNLVSHYRINYNTHDRDSSEFVFIQNLDEGIIFIPEPFNAEYETQLQPVGIQTTEIGWALFKNGSFAGSLTWGLKWNELFVTIDGTTYNYILDKKEE